MKVIIFLVLVIFSSLTFAKDICYKDVDIRCYSEDTHETLTLVTDFVSFVISEGFLFKITETATTVTIEVIGEQK
jgi:hypothetical protein